MCPDFLSSCEAFVRIRRDIHAHPELGAEVPRTAALVAQLLEEWGYETHTGIGGHGCGWGAAQWHRRLGRLLSA